MLLAVADVAQRMGNLLGISSGIAAMVLWGSCWPACFVRRFTWCRCW
jgi:hypothetical protein